MIRTTYHCADICDCLNWGLKKCHQVRRGGNTQLDSIGHYTVISDALWRELGIVSGRIERGEVFVSLFANRNDGVYCFVEDTAEIDECFSHEAKAAMRGGLGGKMRRLD